MEFCHPAGSSSDFSVKTAWMQGECQTRRPALPIDDPKLTVHGVWPRCKGRGRTGRSAEGAAALADESPQPFRHPPLSRADKDRTEIAGGRQSGQQ